MTETRTRGATAATTAVERGLLVALVVLLPIEERLGALPGPGPLPSVSVPWLVFAAMAAAVVLGRREELASVVGERALLFAGALAVVAVVMEVIHDDTDLATPARVGQAVVGAALIATLCRDEGALRVTLWAVMAVGLVTSLVIIGFTYGEWLGAKDLSFGEVTEIRDRVWQPGPLLLDVHYAPFLVVTGALTAFGTALAASARRTRVLLVLAACTGFLAAVLTSARAAAIASVVGAAVVVVARRGSRLGAAIMLGGVVLLVVAVAPDGVFDRLEINSTDSRTRLAEATVDSADDYLPFGVGAGHYGAGWGVDHGFFQRGGGELLGTHNSFAQVTVFWGLAALVALIGVVFESYRSLRRARVDSGARLALCGMAAAALVYLVFSHTLYDKLFVLVLGLVVAAGHWFRRPTVEGGRP